MSEESASRESLDSQVDMELVEAGVGAFNQRDAEKLAGLTTADFEWIPALPRAVEDAVYMGRAGITRYLAETDDTWQQLTVVCDELRHLDDGVLVLGHAVGRGLGSGADVQTPIAFIVTIRAGRISKVSTYLAHDDARRAVGLEE